MCVASSIGFFLELYFFGWPWGKILE